MPAKFEKYNWTQFEKDCAKIAKWASRKKFKSVYGIPRGGLTLAVKLSHLLDVPMILNKEDVVKSTLVVDDIVDGGKTAARLYENLGFRFKMASLYWNSDAKFKPDYYPRKKKRWIIFPWETDRTSRYDS